MNGINLLIAHELNDLLKSDTFFNNFDKISSLIEAKYFHEPLLYDYNKKYEKVFLKTLFCELAVNYATAIRSIADFKSENICFPNTFLGCKFFTNKDHLAICRLISEGLAYSFLEPHQNDISVWIMNDWLDPVGGLIWSWFFEEGIQDRLISKSDISEYFQKKMEKAAAQTRKRKEQKSFDEYLKERLNYGFGNLGEMKFVLLSDSSSELSTSQAIEILKNNSKVIIVDFRSTRIDGSPQISWAKRGAEVLELDLSFFGRTRTRDLFLYLLSKAKPDFIELDLRNLKILQDRASQSVSDLRQVLKSQNLDILYLDHISSKVQDEFYHQQGSSIYRFKFSSPIICIKKV